MNDIELVELIHSKPPEDLSLEEIEQLRAGLASSPNLRREVAERLEMEHYLQAALSRVDLSVDDLLARVERRAAGPTPVGLVLLALCGVFGVVVGTLIVLAIALPSPPRSEMLAQAPAKRQQQVAPPNQTNSSAPEEDAVSESPSDLLRAPTENAEAAVLADESAQTPPSDDAQLQVAQGSQFAVADDADTPWQGVGLLLAGEPAPAPQLFNLPAADQAPPTPEILQQWFAAVPGQPSAFGVRDYGGLRLGSIEGVVRLKAPLEPGLALRLSLLDYNTLRIHAWAGERGAVLDLYDHHGHKPWAGYTASRQDTAPLATKLFLAADDAGRYWRTNPQPLGTVELRYEDGLLTLARGDIRLLDIPLPTPPTEIYFEGNQVYRQIELVRAAPLSLPEPRLTTTKRLVPAEQVWRENIDSSSQLIRHDDGGVELRSEKNQQPVWASFPLLQLGLHEIEFEIASASPGTGLVFCDEQGKSLRQVSFLRDPQTDQLYATNMLAVGDARIEMGRDARQEPVAYLEPPGWIKVLAAPNWFRVWVSRDRLQWARVDISHIHQVRGMAAVGLQNVQQQAVASIKLQSVTVRALNLLNELTPAEMLATSPLLTEPNDFAAFEQAAVACQPADADAATWLRACALRRLTYGAPDVLAQSLVDVLWRDAKQLSLPTNQLCQLLDQLCLVSPTHDLNRAKLALDRYAELANRNEPWSFDQVAKAMMEAPLWANNQFAYFPADLARRQMLTLALAHDAEAMAQFCQRLEFFFIPQTVKQQPFYTWARAFASQDDPHGGETVAMPADWRHPLLIDLNKEAYNVLADLRVALASESYREACQIISTARTPGMRGLLPDADDPDLSISLSASVALAMREHPQLRSTMQAEFGDVARLRVRNAMSDGAEAEIEAATVQFYGTAAAAEAHAWLADRALSAGAFAAAMGHYRSARDSAAPDLLGRINAGEQLAATLLGREVAVKPGVALAVQNRRWSAGDWQRLLTDLRKQRTDSQLLAEPAPRGVVPNAPAPRQYGAAARARLEGDVGQQADQVPNEYHAVGVDWPALALDWVARQTAVLPLADRTLVSNRFQLASYDPNSGQIQWRAGLGGDQAATHSWRLTPARPVATAKWAFVRRFKAAGPVLAAIDLATGNVAWETNLAGEHWVMSDPILTQGTLYAISARHTEWGYTLLLLSIDLQTGVVLRERPLVGLRESWWQLGDCQVWAADERLFIAGGGAVIRCDLMGDVAWVRQQPLVPREVDPFWCMQAQLPPLLHGEKLFVVQLGVPGVAALDAKNGRLLWRANFTTARRVLGVIHDRLLVETAHGVRALDVATGNRIWQFPSSNLLDGYLVGQQGGVVLSERVAVPEQSVFQVRLTWLDVTTGEVQNQSTLDLPPHAQIFFGPTWFTNNRWWAFAGQVLQDPNRNLIELVPK